MAYHRQQGVDTLHRAHLQHLRPAHAPQRRARRADLHRGRLWTASRSRCSATARRRGRSATSTTSSTASSASPSSGAHEPVNLGNPDEFTLRELAEPGARGHRQRRPDRLPGAADRRPQGALPGHHAGHRAARLGAGRVAARRAGRHRASSSGSGSRGSDGAWPGLTRRAPRAPAPTPPAGRVGAAVVPLLAAALLFVAAHLRAGAVRARRRPRGRRDLRRLPAPGDQPVGAGGGRHRAAAVSDDGPLPDSPYPSSLGKLSLADAIMVAMLVVVVLRGATLLGGSRSRARRPAATTALAVCFGLLLVWIAFSIVRNLAPYGIHTVGPVPLLVPGARGARLRGAVPAHGGAAAALRRRPARVLRRSDARRRARRRRISRGGRSARATGSSPPPSLSDSCTGGRAPRLQRARRSPDPQVVRPRSRVPRRHDGHRRQPSLGVAGRRSRCSCTRWSRGRVAAATIARVVALAAAIFAVVLAVAMVRGFDVVGYVITRGSAIVAPSSDDTSSWRLDLWESNLRRWRQHPWTGDGFGGYYAGNLAQGVSQTIQTHSAYVQALVVLGAVGLALLAAITVAVWLVLRREAVDSRRRAAGGLDAVLVELGIAILAGTVAFGIVYPIAAYSYLWVGVALAAAAGLRSALEVKER